MLLIIGGEGQLGSELSLRLKGKGADFAATTISECDLTADDQPAAIFEKYKPTLVINSAAYTAVDRAESDSNLAYRLNCEAAARIGREALRSGATLIQVSTDFVFGELPAPAGRLSPAPIGVDVLPHPNGVYASTKAEGETELLKIFKDEPERLIIIRTSWLYSAHGANFVKTMLRLASERDSLRVVEDQIGRPTWAGRLADFILLLLEKLNSSSPPASGIYHFSNSGVASWYDFAVEVIQLGAAMGLLPKTIPIEPITTEQFPTPAPRPHFSVLDLSTSRRLMSIPHWKDDLKLMLGELAQSTD